MKLWDVSRTLTGNLAPWPGDTPFSYKLVSQIATGSSVNVGAMGMSVHNGTHADAPFHFDNGGNPIDAMPLENYFGPCVVVDLKGRFSEEQREIQIDDLSPNEEMIEEVRRLLIKTNIWTDSSVFPSWIPVIAPKVAEWLQARSVVLIGFDVPSVDPIDAKVLANHHALARAGICIVESLDLSAVEGGIYQFAGFPLKISGGDGAPLRAVLWRA
jgi:arylformamidase